MDLINIETDLDSNKLYNSCIIKGMLLDNIHRKQCTIEENQSPIELDSIYLSLYKYTSGTNSNYVENVLQILGHCAVYEHDHISYNGLWCFILYMFYISTFQLYDIFTSFASSNMCYISTCTTGLTCFATSHPR